jgi:hydrogenase expression/formation protein HypC
VTSIDTGPHCTCITCSDQGIEMRVVALDGDTGLARCTETTGGDTEAVVDVALVTPVDPGDLVLVHAGVALALLERGAPA